MNETMERGLKRIFFCIFAATALCMNAQGTDMQHAKTDQHKSDVHKGRGSNTAGANSKERSNSDRIVIIGESFFREIPVSMQHISRMHMLKTPAGTSAVGLELSMGLPERALEFSVPCDSIPEGALLLRLFQEDVAKGAGIAMRVAREEILKVGEAFPEFSATDIDGKIWTNADIKGKVAVFNLWFTGCGPCRAEMPELSSWKDAMPDVMFFSATYEDAEKARPVIESRKFNWIPLVNDKTFKAFVGRNGYPMTIVIDKNGMVSKVEYGTSPLQRAELKERIEALRK